LKINHQSKSISDEEEIRNLNIRKLLIAPNLDYSQYLVHNLPSIIPREKAFQVQKLSVKTNKSMDRKINSNIEGKSIANGILPPYSSQNIVLFPIRKRRHC